MVKKNIVIDEDEINVPEERSFLRKYTGPMIISALAGAALILSCDNWFRSTQNYSSDPTSETVEYLPDLKSTENDSLQNRLIDAATASIGLEAVVDSSNESSLLNQFLDSCYKTYDVARADSLYGEIIQKIPVDKRYRYFELDTMLGNLYLTKGNYSMALKHLERAVIDGEKTFNESEDFKQTYIAALITYGSTLRDFGLTDKSKKVYEKYQELIDNN